MSRLSGVMSVSWGFFELCVGVISEKSTCGGERME